MHHRTSEFKTREYDLPEPACTKAMIWVREECNPDAELLEPIAMLFLDPQRGDLTQRPERARLIKMVEEQGRHLGYPDITFLVRGLNGYPNQIDFRDARKGPDDSLNGMM